MKHPLAGWVFLPGGYILIEVYARLLDKDPIPKQGEPWPASQLAVKEDFLAQWIKPRYKSLKDFLDTYTYDEVDTLRDDAKQADALAFEYRPTMEEQFLFPDVQMYVCQKTTPSAPCKAIYVSRDKEAACKAIYEDVKTAMRGLCPDDCKLAVINNSLQLWVKKMYKENGNINSLTVQWSIPDSKYYAFICIEKDITLFIGEYGGGGRTVWKLQELQEDQMYGVKEV